MISSKKRSNHLLKTPADWALAHDEFQFLLSPPSSLLITTQFLNLKKNQLERQVYFSTNSSLHQALLIASLFHVIIDVIFKDYRCIQFKILGTIIVLPNPRSRPDQEKQNWKFVSNTNATCAAHLIYFSFSTNAIQLYDLKCKKNEDFKFHIPNYLVIIYII